MLGRRPAARRLIGPVRETWTLPMRRLPGELSQAAVRDAVRQLVDDERFPDAVRGHRPSIDAAPAPEDVVATLAGFA